MRSNNSIWNPYYSACDGGLIKVSLMGAKIEYGTISEIRNSRGNDLSSLPRIL